jgi:mannose-6-phosphate isomerase
MDLHVPRVLPPNQPPCFYRDSGAIARFRGTSGTTGAVGATGTTGPGGADGPGGTRHPEDWIASTTAQFGRSPAGLSTLPDGTRLTDAVAAAPEAWLGPDHVAAHGPDPALLVKLLDAGQRLPLHSHPDRDFARTHLDCPYGKTEAWYVVDAPPDAEIWLGFRREVSADELAAWVRAESAAAADGPARTAGTADTAATAGSAATAATAGSAALRDVVNRVPVAPGDALLCPAGVPHAIGAGILLVELQEPTDFSVLLEWRDHAIDGDTAGHLGLGYERALTAVDRTAWDRERLASLRGPGPRGAPRAGGNVLPAGADRYFRAELLDGDAGGRLGPDFSVLVVLEGGGTLTTDEGHSVPISAGSTVLIPYAAGGTALTGPLTALRCRPPAPGPAPR